MRNFDSADKATNLHIPRGNCALSVETKFHRQKHGGLENIEIRIRALEVALGSITDTNLGHNPSEI